MASISKGITVYGRLSFPVWSFKDAVDRNKKSDFPKADESTVTPEFHLLLDQVQQGETIYARHTDIGENYFGGFAVECGEQAFAILKGETLKSFGAQGAFQHPAY